MDQWGSPNMIIYVCPRQANDIMNQTCTGMGEPSDTRSQAKKLLGDTRSSPAVCVCVCFFSQTALPLSISQLRENSHEDWKTLKIIVKNLQVFTNLVTCDPSITPRATCLPSKDLCFAHQHQIAANQPQTDS